MIKKKKGKGKGKKKKTPKSKEYFKGAKKKSSKNTGVLTWSDKDTTGNWLIDADYTFDSA